MPRGTHLSEKDRGLIEGLAESGKNVLLLPTDLIGIDTLLQISLRFKLKLTPGTGKRGKAAKLALNIFAKEKTCNNRERDLLKSIKEESLARNIPGKVKISAPQLQKLKK